MKEASYNRTDMVSQFENIYSGVNFGGKNVCGNFYLREFIFAVCWENRKNQNPQKFRATQQARLPAADQEMSPRSSAGEEGDLTALGTLQLSGLVGKTMNKVNNGTQPENKLKSCDPQQEPITDHKGPIQLEVLKELQGYYRRNNTPNSRQRVAEIKPTITVLHSIHIQRYKLGSWETAHLPLP